MDNLYLNFRVRHQNITRMDFIKVVSGSQNYVKAKFNFSDDWAGLTKTARFTCNEESFDLILEQDECMIPWEVIKESGFFDVSVFGGSLITVDVARVYVTESGYAEGGSPLPPTPSVYEQIIDKLNEIEAEFSIEGIQKTVDEFLATKDFITEEDVEVIVERILATKDYATKNDISDLATKDDIKDFITEDQVTPIAEEVFEAHKSEFVGRGDYSKFDVIRTFAPFAENYEATNMKTLNMSADEFYNTFYNNYLGYNANGVLVTKKKLGLDESGAYPIWEYTFEPKNKVSGRTICLTSGMHTYELPASFGLARWIKDYMESSDEVFAYMRNNLKICVIPIVNPWGFNQTPKTYGNVNGVNPNRNFDDWSGKWATYPSLTPSEDEWNVKGDKPFSETETQILANFLEENQKAEFWIDCHTGLGCTRANYGDVWNLYTSSNPLKDKIVIAMDLLANHFNDVYGTVGKKKTELDKDSFIKGFFGTDVMGIPTMTIEQAQGSDTLFPTTPNNNATQIIEYACQIHAYIVAQLQ